MIFLQNYFLYTKYLFCIKNRSKTALCTLRYFSGNTPTQGIILSETLFEFLRLVLWIRLKLRFFAYLRDEKCFAFSTQDGGTNENRSFTAFRTPHYFSGKTPTHGSFTPILLFQTYCSPQTVQNTRFYF